MSIDAACARRTESGCKNAVVSRDVAIANSVSVNTQIGIRLNSSVVCLVLARCKKVPQNLLHHWQTIYESSVIEFWVMVRSVAVRDSP